MKIKDDFLLRNISGSYVVVPIGDAVVDFSGLINLNESGAFLFQKLQEGADRQQLVDALLDEYDVTENVASADVDKFITKLKDSGIIE